MLNISTIFYVLWPFLCIIFLSVIPLGYMAFLRPSLLPTFIRLSISSLPVFVVTAMIRVALIESPYSSCTTTVDLNYDAWWFWFWFAIMSFFVGAFFLLAVIPAVMEKCCNKDGERSCKISMSAYFLLALSLIGYMIWYMANMVVDTTVEQCVSNYNVTSNAGLSSDHCCNQDVVDSVRSGYIWYVVAGVLLLGGTTISIISLPCKADAGDKELER